MKKIVIHEVGMRDGLQPEKEIVPLETKIKWCEKLIEANVDIIQIGSFVHPVKVPQMATTDDIFRHFQEKKPKNTILSCLVLNEKGMERGMAVGADMYCMGVSASETHSKKNTGMTTDEALTRIISMAKLAMESSLAVQVSVQSAFGCGFEGKIPYERVYSIIDKYLNAGIKQISLADTAGHAYPEQVTEMFSKIKKMDPDVVLTCHFHNTYGLGMANIYAAIQAGVTNFETAFGGMGGCPFTKVAAGNVSTEDFVYYLQKQNLRDDININLLIETANMASEFFKRPLSGYVYKINNPTS
ncbi:MAG: hydroxymethylglutaryl-CoA lyase [Ignavibacteria bacterium]|jgi:hydroxymethylglutaryl-CoA lyase|nr:hydroxymethylglutaryl-CoA lyase [Ignavibacteria bacterium]